MALFTLEVNFTVAYLIEQLFWGRNSTLVLFKALRPNQQFFSHVGTFSWVEPVQSSKSDEVLGSRIKHRIAREEKQSVQTSVYQVLLRVAKNFTVTL